VIQHLESSKSSEGAIKQSFPGVFW